MNIINFRSQVVINPTITASVAYAAGNQIGLTAYQLPKVVRGPKDITLLQGIVIIDASNQKSAIDFLFWNSKPTGASGTDKAAFAITAADLKARYCGSVSVAAGDYISIGSAQGIATKAFQNVLVQSIQDTNNPDGKDIWVSMICRGTPTYSVATDLEILFKLQ